MVAVGWGYIWSVCPAEGHISLFQHIAVFVDIFLGFGQQDRFGRTHGQGSSSRSRNTISCPTTNTAHIFWLAHLCCLSRSSHRDELDFNRHLLSSFALQIPCSIYNFFFTGSLCGGSRLSFMFIFPALGGVCQEPRRRLSARLTCTVKIVVDLIV